MSTVPFIEADHLRQVQPRVQSYSDSSALRLEDAEDIPVMLALEVGRTSIPIRRLLKLTTGSVIELDRELGSAFDVLVNGRLIAHGEAVVVEDKYNVRLTDVLKPEERKRSDGR